MTNPTDKSKAPTACYGVGCYQHGKCGLYAAISGPSQRTIGTCDTTGKVYPLFVLANIEVVTV